MSARTAARRRKQMKNNYRHLAPLGRPVYKTRSKEAQARRLAKLVETEKRIKSGKKS